MAIVKWQSGAKQDLHEIYDYYCHTKQLPNLAINIRQDIILAARMLELFPEQGSREFSLDVENILFRYLVVRNHYKIIYFHEFDICHIVAIWDCRNNPDILPAKIKNKNDH